MGDSRGRWEGDTFVVYASDFNGNTWFDRAGNLHSDALHLTERYTLIGAAPHPVRGDRRRQEDIHEAVENELSTVSTARARRARARLRVPGIHAAAHAVGRSSSRPAEAAGSLGKALSKEGKVENVERVKGEG